MTTLVPKLPVTSMPRHLRSLGADLVPAMTQLIEQQGSPARISLFGTQVVIVSKAPDIERLFFTGQDVWEKGTEYDVPGLGLREGLVTSRGERWRRDRTMLNPIFSKRNLAPLGDVMAECAVAHRDRLRDGDRVEVVSEMSRVALDIAARTMFGDALDAEEVDVIAEGMEEVLREMVAVGRSPLTWAAERLPGVSMRTAAHAHWRARRVDRRLAQIDAIIEGILERRRRDPDPPTTDFLAQILAARDPATGGPLTSREILEQSATFLLAGHETTATGMAWTWHLLATNPEARDRFHAELDEVLGGRTPVLADLDRLPWLRAVFAEAVRIHPPVYLAMRRANRDDELGGHRVRRGTIAIVLAHLTHRDPEYWPDPLRFDPERFMTRVARPRGAYVPFGGGKRVCIGTQFAMMEAGFVLATLGQRFRLDAVPDWTVREEGTTTLRPLGGLPMRVRARAGVPLARG